MDTTPGKRMQMWREFKGLTLSELSRTTGINTTTISQAESPKGKVSNPSYDTLTKLILAFPDLNPDWLLLGTGPMLRDGRTLTPVAPPATADTQEPEPQGFGAEVEVTVLRRLLVDRDEQLEKKDAKIAELNRELGKPSNGLDAAGPRPTPPPAPVVGFRLAVSNRVKGQGRQTVEK